MRTLFSLLALCLVTGATALTISVPPIKNEDAKAASDTRQEVAEGPAPQTAIHLDARITKVGELPEELKADWWPGQLQFVNERAGWLSVLQESENEPRESGRLWRTRDGGKSWALIYANRENRIEQFQFISSTVGWMRVWGRMYKTTDGGDTWLPFDQPIPPYFDGRLDDFTFFKDGRHGWVAGGMALPLIREDGEVQWPHSRFQGSGETGIRGVIFRTTDGGQSWVRQYVTKWYGEIYSLDLVDEQHGGATGTWEVLRLTGNRWKPTDSAGRDDDGESIVRCLESEIGAPTIGPACLSFLNASTGWLSNNNGYLGKTTDGGRTWSDILNVHDIWPHRDWPLQYLSDLCFENERHGFAIRGDDDGPLYETNDGGRSWANISGATTFAASCFLDAGHGWLVSRRELFKFTP